MPLRDDWQRRIKGVEREFVAVRIAVDGLQQEVAREPGLRAV
jgi:hypothetical protein